MTPLGLDADSLSRPSIILVGLTLDICCHAPHSSVRYIPRRGRFVCDVPGRVADPNPKQSIKAHAEANRITRTYINT